MGPRGITSNVIAPGPIAGTEGVRRLIEIGKKSDRDRMIPLGRMGSLRDMGDAVVYLFAETGDYVTGAVLVGESPERFALSTMLMGIFPVDGGAWRTRYGLAGGGLDYPDTVLSDEPFSSILEKAKL